MAHVQQQIRENSMELQDYLRELKDWEAKAKAKDRVLRGSATSASASDAPPIRGQPMKELDARETAPDTKKVPGEKTGAQKSNTRSAASHTYDYFRDKWDKFDVEKALAEADSESPVPTEHAQAPPKKQSASHPPITSPATIPVPAKTKTTPSSQFAFPSNGSDRPMRPAAKQSELAKLTQEKGPDAASEKEEGNRLFKAGRFAEALEAYRRSLAMAPTSLAYANRAMAALKLEKFQEAEDDCTAAIGLDGRYVKAFSRRGRARSHLGKWLEAAEDFEFALRLEPHNKELLKEYSAARAACLREAKLSPSSVPLPLPVRKASPAAVQKSAPDATQISADPKARASDRKQTSAPGEGRGFGTGGVPVESQFDPAESRGQGNGKVGSGLGAGSERTVDMKRFESEGACLGGIGNENGNEDAKGNGNGSRRGNSNGDRNGNGNDMEGGRNQKPVGSQRNSTEDGTVNGAGLRGDAEAGSLGARQSQGEASARSAHRMAILDVVGAASDNGLDAVAEPEGHVSRSEPVSLVGAESSSGAGEAKQSPMGVSTRVDITPRDDQTRKQGGDKSSGGVSEPSPTTPGPHSDIDIKNSGGDVLKTGQLAVASAAAEKLQRALAENVSASRTAYEFEAQWKGFKDDAGAKARLLKTLHPAQLAPFFKESLQGPLLCDMLRVVAGELLPGDAAFAADLLEGLSTVPRFAMTVMFITGKDKQSLRHLWDTAATEESVPVHVQTRLAACRTKYRM